MSPRSAAPGGRRLQHDRARDPRLALPERRLPHPRRRLGAAPQGLLAADSAGREPGGLRDQRRARRHLPRAGMERGARPLPRRGLDAPPRPSGHLGEDPGIPDHIFWSVRQDIKARLFHMVRHRMSLQHARNHGSESHLERLLKYADPATRTSSPSASDAASPPTSARRCSSTTSTTCAACSPTARARCCSCSPARRTRPTSPRRS